MQGRALWYIPASHMKAIKQVEGLCPESFVMPDPGSEENIEKVIVKAHPEVLATDMGELSETNVKIVHDNGAMVFVDEKKVLRKSGTRY